LFALSAILSYVNAFGIDPSLWTPEKRDEPTDVVVFGDFYNNDNKFNLEAIQKYGVTLDSDKKTDPDAPNCFTVVNIKNGTIVRAMSLIDIKLDEEHMRDCVLRDINYSFGLNIDFLKVS